MYFKIFVCYFQVYSVVAPAHSGIVHNHPNPTSHNYPVHHTYHEVHHHDHHQPAVTYSVIPSEHTYLLNSKNPHEPQYYLYNQPQYNSHSANNYQASEYLGVQNQYNYHNNHQQPIYNNYQNNHQEPVYNNYQNSHQQPVYNNDQNHQLDHYSTNDHEHSSHHSEDGEHNHITSFEYQDEDHTSDYNHHSHESHQTHHYQTTYDTPVTKKFIYFHVPPPEFDRPQYQAPVTPPKKTYKIIFIKAPAQVTKQHISVPSPIEEKTLIYVLVKKPQDPSIHIPTSTVNESKPEVFYVKYKQNKVEDIASQVNQGLSIDGLSNEDTLLPGLLNGQIVNHKK